MVMTTNSVKCAQCGLVNFADAEECKRCCVALAKAEGEGTRVGPQQQRAEGGPQKAQGHNLTHCPDCAHLCSRMAEVCPNCGRVLRQLDKPVKSILRPVVVVGVFAAVCLCAVLVYSNVRRETAVQTAVQKGDVAEAGVSDGNREAARAAMNSIGEVQSVTSVGTNFMQYGSELQSAKIKFDAAMRDYRPRDAADHEIKRQLEEAFYCYVDAREAWSEFIEHGSEYGFLEEENILLKDMATQYGFSASSGHFYRSTVIQTIWAKASKTLNSINERLR